MPCSVSDSEPTELALIRCSQSLLALLLSFLSSLRQLAWDPGPWGLPPQLWD